MSAQIKTENIETLKNAIKRLIMTAHRNIALFEDNRFNEVDYPVKDDVGIEKDGGKLMVFVPQYVSRMKITGGKIVVTKPVPKKPESMIFRISGEPVSVTFDSTEVLRFFSGLKLPLYCASCEIRDNIVYECIDDEYGNTNDNFVYFVSTQKFVARVILPQEKPRKIRAMVTTKADVVRAMYYLLYPYNWLPRLK